MGLQLLILPPPTHCPHSKQRTCSEWSSHCVTTLIKTLQRVSTAAGMKWKDWLLATSSKPSSKLSLLGPRPLGPCLIPRPQHAVLSPSFGNAPLLSLCLQPLPTKNSMSAPLPPSDGQCFLEEAFLITQQWPQFIMSFSLGYLFIGLEPHP